MLIVDAKDVICSFAGVDFNGTMSDVFLEVDHEESYRALSNYTRSGSVMLTLIAGPRRYRFPKRYAIRARARKRKARRGW